MCPIVVSYDRITDFAGRSDDSSQSERDADCLIGRRTTYVTEWPEHGAGHNQVPLLCIYCRM